MFCSSWSFPLIVDLFPSILACNPNLFSFNDLWPLNSDILLLSLLLAFYENGKIFQSSDIHCPGFTRKVIATCGSGSAYPFGAPAITPSFWWGSCCLFFSFLCCVMCTIVCLFFLFNYSHGVVSLFSIYEFDCPFGIFRPSFLATKCLTKELQVD